MKPKQNQAGDPNESKGYDRCNTPPYGVDPLLPYLPGDALVWEPAAGTGNIARTLAPRRVVATDLYGDYAKPPRNFFDWQPPTWDMLVTNPPYSIKFDWLERCYQLGKPFALLVPVETIGAKAAQAQMERYGCELLLLNRRVNFEMPNKGWEGSAAQFPVLWLCWQLLPAPIVYGKLTQRHSDQLMLELEAA